MKLTVVTQSEFVERFICIACDVAKNKLDIFTELEINGKKVEITDSFDNKVSIIEKKLLKIKEHAQKAGIKKIVVVCESTGGYEKKLLEVALRLGFMASYVASGNSKRANRITSNDPEKSDEKDCRAIHLVAADLGKTMAYRPLEGVYRQLRAYNGWYKEINDRMITLQCLLHSILKELFCEFSKDNSYIFDNVGRAIATVTGFDPRRIVRLGKEGFVEKVKELKKYAKVKVLEQIFDDALASLKLRSTDSFMDILGGRFRSTYRLWELEHDQKVELSQKMQELYKQTEEYEKLKEFESFSDKQMARIIAETGPLSDFQNQRQLIRYAGLNLCRRQSGKYIGQTRISKCGRVPLRYVLYQSVWASLHKKKSEISAYYKKKRKEGKSHASAMTACMRKSLKIIFAAFNSVKGYDKIHLEQYLAQLSAA